MEVIKFNDFINNNYKSNEDIESEEYLKKLFNLLLIAVFLLLSIHDFLGIFQKIFIGLDFGIVQDAFLRF